ncbi:MAG: M1 family aminopeptidase, partial [Bryobacteraceae bacterium]
WLMEGLSSYSALMFYEKRKGRKALEDVLDAYRVDLMQKSPNGRTIESAGPIVWGIRLNSSLSPNAWRTIMYEKGAWIIHMLRSRLGDAQFLKMLGEVVRQKQYKPLTTEEFRLLATGFLPAKAEDPKLEAFFDQWVYGTGIPSFRISHAIKGKGRKLSLSGTIAQSGVDEEFSAFVPVEVQLPGKRSLTHWVRTSSEPVTFDLALPAAPLKVILNPGSAILTAR